MKLTFGETKGPFHEVEIDPEMTQDAVKEKLIKEVGFKQGDFIFIFSGKVLKDKAPFKALKEKSRVIVFIKEAKQAKEEQKKEGVTPKEEAKPAPATPRPAPRPAPTPAQEPQRPQMPPQQPSQDQQAAEIIKVLELDKIYDPANSVWDNTTMLAQVSQILNENPAHLSQLIFQKLKSAIPGVDQNYIFNTICLLLDYQIADFLPCTDEIEAKLETLSKSQKEIYKSLLSEFKDKQKVLDALEAASFNKDEAIKALKQ